MIRLEVIGVPAPQGSKVRVGKVMLDGTSTTGRAKLAEWRRAVADAARRHLEVHPGAPLREPLEMTIHFTFAPTKSDPYRFWHSSKPDLDKIIRATFDALKGGGLIADDSLVCKLTTTKHYSHDGLVGAVIEVVSLGLEEAAMRDLFKQRAAEDRRAARGSAA